MSDDDEPCTTCPERRDGKDECCRCPKCGSEITRYVARDSGRSWITRRNKTTVPEAIIWRCLECGNVYTVDPGIKCCNDAEAEIGRARGALIGIKWDGDDSKPILEETVELAGDRMKAIMKAVKEKLGIDIGPAFIAPGHHGKVELLWKDDDFVLSVGVPESKDSPTFYAGRDAGGIAIKGRKSFEKTMNDITSWIEKLNARADPGNEGTCPDAKK